jgi:hypothetical protein
LTLRWARMLYHCRLWGPFVCAPFTLESLRFALTPQGAGEREIVRVVIDCCGQVGRVPCSSLPTRLSPLCTCVCVCGLPRVVCTCLCGRGRMCCGVCCSVCCAWCVLSSRAAGCTVCVVVVCVLWYVVVRGVCGRHVEWVARAWKVRCVTIARCVCRRRRTTPSTPK